MKKQFELIGIIFLFLIVGLSGCDENVTKAEKEKFIGTWYGYTVEQGQESYGKTVIFYSSGLVVWTDSLQYTYRIEENKLYVDYGDISADVYSYAFKNDYHTLILSLLDPNSENDKDYTIHLIK